MSHAAARTPPEGQGAPLRVAAVFGARPSAIKMAPLVAALRDAVDVDVQVIASGQHRELLDQVLQQTGLRVDVDLDVMRDNQELGGLLTRTIAALGAALDRADPQLVLVHGDTTTSVAAALAAFYQRRPIAHVEAGMRTGDLAAPFPEEGHRRITATLASLHLAPSDRAREALLAEGVDPARVVVTGNTGLDALAATLGRLMALWPAGDAPDGAWMSSFLADSALAEVWRAARSGERRLVIVTAQRRESFGEGLVAICDALQTLARDAPGVDFVWPVHPNPHVGPTVAARLGGEPNVHLVAPLDHLRFVALLRDAWCVLTDSGGVQEEAPALGVPLFVLRDRTERAEVIESGAGVLVGLSAGQIVGHVGPVLRSQAARAAMAKVVHPWGGGDAAVRTVEAIRAWRWSPAGPGA